MSDADHPLGSRWIFLPRGTMTAYGGSSGGGK
jgi:hypothetical protein